MLGGRGRKDRDQMSEVGYQKGKARGGRQRTKRQRSEDRERQRSEVGGRKSGKDRGQKSEVRGREIKKVRR